MVSRKVFIRIEIHLVWPMLRRKQLRKLRTFLTVLTHLLTHHLYLIQMAKS